jgi:agmatinase
VRRAVEEGLVQPQRSLIAGLRGPLVGAGELDWPAAMGFDLIGCEELRAIGPAAFAERVRERVGEAPVHLSVDLDVVDPAYAPATGTPEIGGLTSGELVALLRALAGTRFRAFDVVELTPPYDSVGQPTALLAANVVYEYLALAAVGARPA